MIVTCPACTTRYLVDPRALGDAGRVVRCANCSKTWHQTPPEDFPRTLDISPAEVAPDLTPDFTTGGRVQLPALPPRRGRPWATIAGGVVLAILLSGAVAAIAAREQVIALWPPATRLYTMVGLPMAPPGVGLELRKTVPAYTSENGVRTLVVDGEIVNISQIARDVPALKVILRDRDGGDLQSLSFSVAEQRLLPGASVPFHTSIPRPNPAATSVLVTIGDGG
jgi:predicted Zn finger-like uncharacterized protein